MLSVKLPKLLNINQVPKVFHEESIMSGYRHPRSTAYDCIFSVFQMTNETLNIWTHFLPTWYFLWKLFALLYRMDFWNEAYSWPITVYMLSCCIYPFTSSCAHTFSSMSTRARHICFFFDYAVVSLYSLGSAIAYSFYIFPDRWVNSSFHNYFVPIAVFNAIISTALSCYSRLGAPLIHYNCGIIERFPEIERPKLSKAVRIVAFALPYLFDSIPVFFRLFICSGEDCTHNESIPDHYKHVTFAFLTGFLFSTHLPERLAPGCFDYIGHSHQLFHIGAIIGTHFQMEALIIDMNVRRDWLLVNSPLPSLSNTVGAVGVCLIFSLLIILVFSLALYWKPDDFNKEKET